MDPKGYQLRAVDAVLDAVDRGQRRICLTGPTGCGKSLIMQLLARKFLDWGNGVVLYTNRKLLIEQISGGLMEAGIYHGIRAAGYEDEREHPFQVASIQTEHSRSMRHKLRPLHDAALALVDEGHLHTGPTSKAILDAHHAAGAVYVLVTATPIDMAHVCDVLIQVATVSECRDEGMLVYAHHYAPDEPDMRSFQKLREGYDLTEGQNRQAIMRPGIFGRVWDNFERLNPDHKPTILFAPGVSESIWFAEQFTAQGVRAAHIDGEDIWLDGELYRSSRELRQEVLKESKTGDIKVLSNRFILREGIDAPWLACGILATVFGSLQSFLQSGGRLLRASVGKESTTIIDHGGNYWRHGSLNEDRVWHLDDTASSVYGVRADRIRQKKLHEPFTCPQCHRVWQSGKRCNPAIGGCGYELTSFKKSRPVVAADGTLKQVGGDIFKPRRVNHKPDGIKKWEQMYWRSRTEKGSRTFAAAMALYAAENNWGWPARDWPFMPVDDLDIYRLVVDVPRERLVGKKTESLAQ